MEDIRKKSLVALKASFIALFASVLLCIGSAFVLAPEKAHAADGTHIATIQVEGYGTITAELDRNAAPATVNNFVKLAQRGFYNGLTFHRISKGFCIQGGDPKGDGTGGSSTKIKGEFAANGFYNPIKHVAGTLSMARASDYNSASSQFFIVPTTSSQNTSALDGKYAAFGRVISGMDVVNKLNNVATVGGTGSDKDKPKSTIKIKSITIKTMPSSGKWVKSGSRYWYKYDAQTAQAKGKAYPRNQELSINGKTYRFDGAGWMKTGWQMIDNKWYYYGGKSDGAKKTGWQKVSGKWYYMDPATAVMQTGRLDLRYWDYSGSGIVQRGDVYLLSSSGAMRTGWVKQSGKWYFYQSSGAMASGTIFNTAGKWYIVDHNGVMETGIQEAKIGNTTYQYYFSSSGAMKAGWQKVSGKWYYFGTDSHGLHPMLKNRWISGKYWVGSNGVMATNAWVDGDRYYVDGNGKWVKGKKKPTAKSSTSAQSATTNDSVATKSSTAKAPDTRSSTPSTSSENTSSDDTAAANEPDKAVSPEASAG